MLKINLTELFENGFTYQKIQTPCEILEVISKLNFQDTNEKYNDSNAPLLTLQVPENIQEFFIKLLNEYEEPFTQIYGNFLQRQFCLHSYRQGDGLEWHNDASRNFPINHILYLGDETWHESFGGHLSIKNNHKIQKIFPENGTLVSILNWNPLFLHKVEKMKLPLKRYSLMCKSGY
jgi:hypothetical protein